MRYISTRGEAPALGFIDVTLAGLARDGGLYVPDSWPRFRAEQIAALAGRPYAEVACEIVRPFVGGAIRGRRSLAHGARRLRQVPPSGGRAARATVARHFRARAVSRADARLQGSRDAVPRAADGSCAEPARRALDHRGRDLGRYRRRGGRGVPRQQAGRRDRALSAWPHLRRAAAHDDDAERAERACARDRGHVRRLPGDREGPVQSSWLSRPRAALRRQLDQLGAHRRAGGLLLHRGGRARRAAPQSRLHGADGKFRRRVRRLCGDAHGVAGRAAGRRHQRQRHPGAHAEDRHLRGARRDGDRVALDGHPGLVQFRAAAVRRLRSRSCAGARADGIARAIAPLHHRAAAARRNPLALHRRSRRRGRDRRHHPHGAARGWLPASIRTPPLRSRSPRRKHRDPRGADGGAVDRASGEISRRGQSRVRIRPALPDWLATSTTRPERVTVLPNDQGAVEKFILAASRAAREGAAA